MRFLILVPLAAFLMILTSCGTKTADQKTADTLMTEAFRPVFHFTPPAHWMNDPNGLIYYNDTYHLFYQHFPDSTVWGPMHWGHATSTDLFHWNHEPIALYPDSLGLIFSGSAVFDKSNTSRLGNKRKSTFSCDVYISLCREGTRSKS